MTALNLISALAGASALVLFLDDSPLTTKVVSLDRHWVEVLVPVLDLTDVFRKISTGEAFRSHFDVFDRDHPPVDPVTKIARRD